MNLTDIANIRLISQQIEESHVKTVKELVGWMGAMQAQDYAMAKWAISLQLPGSIRQGIETAESNGKIILDHDCEKQWFFGKCIERRE
jgi:hypothetical protein